MEIRSNTANVGTKGNKITGTASPVYDGTAGTEYTLWDGTVERFAPGAFDDHLSQSPDVVAQYNHQRNMLPLGRVSAGTLKVWTDKRGLHYEVEPPDIQFVRDLKVSIERGDIRGSSFTFIPVDVEWQTDGTKDVRLIRKANVYEVSPVTEPAYGASTCNLRSLPDEERRSLEIERDSYRARIETEKRLARIDKLVTQA